MRNLLLSILLFFPACSHSIDSKLEEGKVIAILDGDTVLIDLGGTKERVRLIGIDSPEASNNEKTVHDSKATGEAIASIMKHGKSSTQHLKSLVKKGSIVELEYDVKRRDKFGRILAYVYLKDHIMLNERMIIDGYAHIFTVPPNVKYVKRFKQAEKAARNAKLGLWADQK